MTDAPLLIVHDADAHRFTATLAEGICEIDYHLIEATAPASATTMAINHTGVPSALEGRGLAAKMVAHALAHARAQGWRVRPVCSYVQLYMTRHAETRDLLERR